MFRRLANLFARPITMLSLADDSATMAREQSAYLLASETLDVAELLSQHPPKIEHPKKRLLFDIALARGLSGLITVRRYKEIPLPITYRPYCPETEIVVCKGHFRYSKSDVADDWFMNFAHHDLFSGYGHFMFAQDEIQVAEHPALASVREMMLCRSDHFKPLTVENGSPTPILFRGVQRMLRIETRSIYGARFARSEDAVIRECAGVIAPPTHSNILAIEAPISTGNKIYVRSEIEAALRTAYSGFRAAILTSVVDSSPIKPIVIHTGNWGCGAYGGNRQLMLSVQIMAARLAGISKAVFYCGTDSKDDVTAFESALSRRFKFRPGAKIDGVVDRLVAAAFRWGGPDGN